jgi:hypothetical protein
VLSAHFHWSLRSNVPTSSHARASKKTVARGFIPVRLRSSRKPKQLSETEWTQGAASRPVGDKSPRHKCPVHAQLTASRNKLGGLTQPVRHRNPCGRGLARECASPANITAKASHYPSTSAATRTGVTKTSVQCEIEVATIIRLAQSGIPFGLSCLQTTKIAHTSFL